MTREEAIYELKNAAWLGTDHLRERTEEAVEMAIKALSQEPCDDGNNLCSSCTNIGCEFQSGIVRTKCAFYMPPHIETDNCGNYVIMQPSVTQKSGKWIGKDFRKEEYVLVGKCSVCGQVRVIDKFCPNCGAKMVEPKESEEISDRNMKMWEELFKAEREGKE